MAQARSSVVLLAASKCAEDPDKTKYLKLSELLLNPVFIPVSQGGAMLINGKKVWYQEYAQGTRVLPTVLNGHLYTVEALSHIISYFPKYRSFYNRALSSTCLNVQEFNVNFWSLYDLNHYSKEQSYFANLKYHKTHIRQLHEYAYIFPCHAELTGLSTTFSNYLKSPLDRLRWFYVSGFSKRSNIAFLLLFTLSFLIFYLSLVCLFNPRSNDSH